MKINSSFLEQVLDRKRLAELADWTAVAVAVSLPWSTSATSILLVVLLLTLIPTLNVAMLRQEVQTAAGGLPVLLWLLAATGMLWADVTWTERIHGLGSFHRLLMIPLLLAQFRRSERGVWVLYGLFASTVILLLVSWLLALVHANGLSTYSHKAFKGVAAKDYISQSTLFLVCAFALIWRVCDLVREHRWGVAAGAAALVVFFIANITFVVTSRTALVVAPPLILLLGWRQFGWKGAMIACAAGAVLALGAWESSTYFRERLIQTTHQVQAYRATDEGNATGEHIEFLKKSMIFVRSAPLIGHGTGSVADLFRRSAIGETGAAGVSTVNPHNQVFAVAIQLGLAGAAILLAMWTAHYFLFRTAGWIAWAGAVIVIDNVVSSLANSSLFDFTPGWLYVLGVGVIGGALLRKGVAAGQDPALQHQH
jgi:O-antigen ligase